MHSRSPRYGPRDPLPSHGTCHGVLTMPDCGLGRRTRDEQRTIAAGLDGSDWLIQGSPRGALRGLGELFFELAGPPLAEVRICLPASTGTGGIEAEAAQTRLLFATLFATRPQIFMASTILPF
jgi:hypothetical protein